MEYRVEQLARSAGISVDTVRFYQSRGLLPGPRREGRVALYAESHLERLRRIRALRQEGFTLAQIHRLVEAPAPEAPAEAPAEEAAEEQAPDDAAPSESEAAADDAAADEEQATAAGSQDGAAATLDLGDYEDIDDLLAHLDSGAAELALSAEALPCGLAVPAAAPSRAPLGALATVGDTSMVVTGWLTPDGFDVDRIVDTATCDDVPLADR